MLIPIPPTAKLIHNIGVSPSEQAHIKANYTPFEKVYNAKGILTFDGVYKSVYEHRGYFMERNCILFVMGDYIGKDNSFDKGMPREQYCTIEELNNMALVGYKLGWHTWSHPDLTTLSDEDIIREITPPSNFPTQFFAYPYGRWDERVVNHVKKIFDVAYSVNETDGTQYTIPREYIV